MENQLLEKWDALIEHEGAPHVSQKEVMAQLLESEETYMVEAGSVNADMAQYTPILVPAVRRIFPNLLANEIVGTQAMNAPTGYAYALRFGYNQSSFGGALPTGAGTGTGANTPGVAQSTSRTNDRTGMTAPTFGSFAILAANPSQTFSGYVNAIAANAVSGVIAYAEPGRALILSMAATAMALLTPGATGSTSTGGTFTITALFNNEAGYQLIFKNYFGPVSTAAGEVLGAVGGTDIASMKMTLERVQIEAQTRKLKAEYTLELAQDLKAVHGLDAEAELINILEYEISAQLDRELIDLINAKATVVQGWSYGANFNQGATGAINGQADGRWEQEKFRTLYTKILREAHQIALQTRRGSANFLVVSSNVAAALESLSGFMYSAVPGSVKPTLGVAKIGTLDGRFTVYLDTFATTDYCTLGYKGTSAFDTGIIYCPYIPLMLQKVTDPNTFQPKIAFMTRDAITGNLWGVEKYYRRFSVDFTGSSLGQGGIWGNGAGLVYPAGGTTGAYPGANW
jgi:hypothetical protein